MDAVISSYSAADLIAIVQPHAGSAVAGISRSRRMTSARWSASWIAVAFTMCIRRIGVSRRRAVWLSRFIQSRAMAVSRNRWCAAIGDVGGRASCGSSLAWKTHFLP